MNKSKFVMVSSILSACLMFNSCIGSHALFNKVQDWNQSVSNKWVNEILYFAMWCVPVYEISLLADMWIFNSIEFWTGSNPMAAGTVKHVKGADGKEYAITSNKDGYTITQSDKSVDLKFDSKDNSWNVVANGKSHKLMTVKKDATADVYLQNGQSINVSLDAQGATAVREAAMAASYAAR